MLWGYHKPAAWFTWYIRSAVGVDVQRRCLNSTLTSEPPRVSLRMPVTNLVVEAFHGTGVVKMPAVVHPCGPAVGKRLSRFRT